jgi:hypothetical protein
MLHVRYTTHVYKIEVMLHYQYSPWLKCCFTPYVRGWCSGHDADIYARGVKEGQTGRRRTTSRRGNKVKTWMDAKLEWRVYVAAKTQRLLAFSRPRYHGCKPAT